MSTTLYCKSLPRLRGRTRTCVRAASASWVSVLESCIRDHCRAARTLAAPGDTTLCLCCCDARFYVWHAVQIVTDSAVSAWHGWDMAHRGGGCDRLQCRCDWDHFMLPNTAVDVGGVD